MTELVSAVSGSFFPRLSPGRPARRFSDHIEIAQGEEESIADNAYAHPLCLPPGSTDVFAACTEEASERHLLHADAFAVLSHDFAQILQTPAAPARFSTYI